MWKLVRVIHALKQGIFPFALPWTGPWKKLALATKHEAANFSENVFH